jgi:hypothetical protein
MAVGFSRPVVRVRRGKAPIQLRCSGTIANRCVGTLVLRAAGTAQKAVYSIARGKTATVELRLRRPLLRKLAVARRHGGAVQVRLFSRTAQTSGSPVFARHLIRLK